jgi:hypothetical protein
MRNVLIAAAVVTLVSQISAQSPAPAAPKISLTFESGGTVSLTASSVSVRDVLAEWARKGGTTFVGAERLPATPVILQFEHRPETEVVGSLLRSASGYVIGPLREAANGTSTVGVVYVLATSTASTATFTSPTPSYTPPQQQQISTPGSPDSEIPPVGPGRAGQAPAGQQQDATPSPAPRPAGVSGVAVPVVPVVPVTTPTPTATPPGPGRGGGGGR